MRGIAAIYVVLFHSFSALPLSNFLTTFVSHGYLAVDLFFVLSGFVMAMTYGHRFASGWSRGAYLQFLGRRIARIYPLYLVATIVGFFLIVSGCLDASKSPPLGITLVLNLIMIQAWGLAGSLDAPCWSISAEFAAYLIFPALLSPTVFCRGSSAWMSGIACAALVAGLCLLPASFHHGEYKLQAMLDFHDVWLALPVFRCLPEFMLGMLAFRVAETPFGLKMGADRWVPLAVSLMTLAALATPRADLAAVLLFPILTICVASGRSIPVRVLSSAPASLLGSLSFSIYLIHGGGGTDLV